MKYKVLFTSLLIGVMLLASCTASKNSPVSFESPAVEQAVRTALDDVQCDISPDMLADLDTAIVVDGQVSLQKGEGTRKEGQGKILSADPNRTTDPSNWNVMYNLEGRTNGLSDAAEIYWQDKKLQPTYTDLSGLENLPALRRVILLVPDADTVAQVAALPQVEWLKITLQADQILELPDLGNMKQLKILDIEGGSLQDAENIAAAKNLTELNLLNGVQVDDWQFLTKLDNLTHLNLPSGFKDMQLAESLEGLEFFNICNSSAQEFLDAWRNAAAASE